MGGMAKLLPWLIRKKECRIWWCTQEGTLACYSSRFDLFLGSFSLIWFEKLFRVWELNRGQEYLEQVKFVLYLAIWLTINWEKLTRLITLGMEFHQLGKIPKMQKEGVWFSKLTDNTVTMKKYMSGLFFIFWVNLMLTAKRSMESDLYLQSFMNHWSSTSELRYGWASQSQKLRRWKTFVKYLFKVSLKSSQSRASNLTSKTINEHYWYL